jgi:hypothetical protein
MPQHPQKDSTYGFIVLLFALLNAVVLERGLVRHPESYMLLFITIPVMLIAGFFYYRKA